MDQYEWSFLCRRTTYMHKRRYTQHMNTHIDIHLTYNTSKYAIPKTIHNNIHKYKISKTKITHKHVKQQRVSFNSHIHLLYTHEQQRDGERRYMHLI